MKHRPLLHFIVPLIVVGVASCGAEDAENVEDRPTAGAAQEAEPASAAESTRPYDFHILEYRVVDPPEAVLASFDGTEAATLEALEDVEPRVSLTVPVERGAPTAVDHPTAGGTVTIEPASGDSVEVAMELGRFFRGTPLLIETCAPHVVTRARIRVQGRYQITLRAIQVRDESCPTG